MRLDNIPDFQSTIFLSDIPEKMDIPRKIPFSLVLTANEVKLLQMQNGYPLA